MLPSDPHKGKPDFRLAPKFLRFEPPQLMTPLAPDCAGPGDTHAYGPRPKLMGMAGQKTSGGGRRVLNGHRETARESDRMARDHTSYGSRPMLVHDLHIDGKPQRLPTQARELLKRHYRRLAVWTAARDGLSIAVAADLTLGLKSFRGSRRSWPR